MDQLSRSGLTPEESFLIAARRIGCPAELERQYEAVHPPAPGRRRAIWMIAGVLGYGVVTRIAAALSKLVLLAAGGTALSGTTLGMWGAMAYLLALIGFGWLFLKHARRRISRDVGLGESVAGSGGAWWIVGLAAASLAVTSAGLTLDVLAAKLTSPRTLGGYALTTAYFMTPLNFLAVVALGVWLSRRGPRQLQAAGAVSGLLLLSFAPGCSPARPSEAATNPNSAAPPSTTASRAPAGQGTPFEQCYALVAGNSDGAVEAFMKLDLGSGALFSFGTPLSYSEAQFASLSQPVREKIAEPMLQDITQVKRLIGAVKDRRDQARAIHETEKADRFSKQLAALGTRLQGAENLKLTQLVGQSASRVAAQ